MHNQALDWTLGNLLKRARKDCMSQVVKVITLELTETTNLGTQELTDSGLTAKQPSWDWPRPSTCVSHCIARSACGTHSSRCCACPWIYGWLLETLPHTRLLYQALLQGEGFSPTSTWDAILCWHPWEACPFPEQK